MTAPNTDNLVSSLIGSGVEVTNAEYTGDSRAAGIFNDPSLGIGIDSGIILSTGDVANIYGPNNSDSTSTAFATDGDADLNQLVSPSATRDAAVLEFDFTPTKNFISFQYVFASEEYNEFVNSSFNDVFGFFITDSQGNKQNIAVIPGTNTPIAVNNVNLVSNSGYYRNNDPSDYGFGNTPFNIGFDGLTTPLTAVATVTPGQTYHFKLAIADNSDSVYDSAVFIKNGGFISTPLVSVNDGANVAQDTPITIDVLANDLTPVGETPSIVDFQEVSDNGGSVTLLDNGTPDNLADDQLVYTPSTGFSGVDQFEYTLADSEGNTSISEVFIQVQASVLLYQQYNFIYTYGNGDSYSGYGYTDPGTYTVGQVLDGYTNETGNQGYYTIDSVGNTSTGSNNYVYVTSYTDVDTGYGSVYGAYGNGYSGLGSEYGYANNANSTGDTYFNSYNEADLPAVLRVRLNLLADNNGTPGEIISNDQVGLNRSFFVEIQVGDLRGNAAGVNGLGLNLAWDGLILESIDTPFDPANIITANFPLLQDGTVDNSSGLINNLSGGSLPAFELGQAIGVNQLERFALLRFQTENSTGTYYFTTTVDSAALADDNPYYSLDVETSQPILISSVYSQYNFTYNYGNGDSYTGYVYAMEGTYTVSQTIGGTYNETGNYGYYTVDSIASTTLDSSYNNRVYVTSYNDVDTGFGAAGYLNSGTGYYGLGSEYGYAYDANVNSADPYFSQYYEADILANQKYNFTYSYGNGDSYSGYGYAAVGTYTAGQVLGGYANETGYTGAYTINSVELGNTNAGYNNLVYVTSYTDGDTGYGETTNLWHDWQGVNGYYGLGSEYGYAYDANGYSSDSYFSNSAEADIQNQLFNYTYTYGNGDSYSGYGYAAAGTYTAGQVLSGYANETGNTGYYTIDSVSAGTTDSFYNNRVYVTSYTDGDTGYGTTINVSHDWYYGWNGDSGLGSEAGYVSDTNGNSSDSYFSNSAEADILGNQKYNFTYNYGNGDSYSGYGYAAVGTYTAGQVLGGYANETGYTGQYTIDSVELGNTNAGYNGYVYVTSYTDGDTGFGAAGYLNIGTGYSGLGSEYGYAYDSSGNSSDSSFSQYYEADIQNQLFNYTYTYGNGDSYSGYGYALAGTYTAGQTIGSIANETGYTGQYTIDSVSAGTTDSSYNNSVYVTTYTDGDTLYGETTNLGSYVGGSGLGSEYGYAYAAEGYTYDSYFSQYSEADLVIPGLAITDNSGNANDSSIKFTTELSKFRKGYQDSDYVRPNYADTTKYFDINNTGTGILVVSDIQINVGGVTVNNLDLSGDKDLLVNPGSSQRVNLTYDPLVAGENFNVTNGLVLFTNVPNWSQYEVALSGKSTFNSDINYDGKVNTGDLGSLNQARTNFNKGIFDATTDINGDGLINTLDASALTADIRLKLSV